VSFANVVNGQGDDNIGAGFKKLNLTLLEQPEKSSLLLALKST